MPNRILKESICTSETIERLNPEEECFFYRIMVNCDDYGRMDARSSILLAKCYPLRVETLKAKDITKMLETLVLHRLIFIYGEGKYLQMITWDKHQQVRAKKSKFPQPTEEEVTRYQTMTDNEYHMISDDSICPRNPIQSESNPNPNPNPNPIPYGEIMNLFNNICISLPSIKEMSQSRKTVINSRWKQLNNSLDDCTSFFNQVEQSDWLSGRNDKGWKASFDWIFKAANFTKIIEGNFTNNKERGANGTNQQSTEEVPGKNKYTEAKLSGEYY